jgi:hypothetical protein
VALIIVSATLAREIAHHTAILSLDLQIVRGIVRDVIYNNCLSGVTSNSRFENSAGAGFCRINSLQALLPYRMIRKPSKIVQFKNQLRSTVTHDSKI